MKITVIGDMIRIFFVTEAERMITDRGGIAHSNSWMGRQRILNCTQEFLLMCKKIWILCTQVEFRAIAILASPGNAHHSSITLSNLVSANSNLISPKRWILSKHRGSISTESSTFESGASNCRTLMRRYT